MSLLVWVCLLANFLIEWPRIHTKPLVSFAGHGPCFIAHGTSLQRSSPVTTDAPSYLDTFSLASTLNAADFP